MSKSEVFIVSAQRTPIGAFQGSLSALTAPQLGAAALRAVLERGGVGPEQVDEVFLGNVLSAAIGQAPARQAALGAGLPNTVPCTTVNKVCGSGLQAVIFGANAIRLGQAHLVIAGGMEAMSRVPYYLSKAREGYRLGDGQLIDGLIFDGLHDPYNDFHMGVAAELCAAQYGLTRSAQDDFARESYRRALQAQQQGAFAREITAVEVPSGKGTSTTVSQDEEPARGKPDKFALLKPAFRSAGTITAANASSINDGAAAVLLASEQAVERHGLQPLACITGHAGAAQAPEWFTTAPVKAVERLFDRTQLPRQDVDLWEINEAFSCVALACSQLLGLEPERVNVHGGAVALGHPLGATGARLLVTLIHALRAQGKRRGVAALCIGGGEGLALSVEAYP